MKNTTEVGAYSGAVALKDRPQIVESPSADCSTAALRRLLGWAMWPDSECLCRPAVNNFASKPSEKRYEEGEAGKFFSKKLDRTVAYGSVIEHDFLCLLENSKDVKWYLERPVNVRFVRGREPVIYVPDVLVCLGRDQYCIVEIKKVTEMLAHSHMDKYLALRGYCFGIGWGVLICDGQFAFGQLARHKPDPDYVVAIRARLQEGPLDYCGYKEIESIYGATQLDLAAVVLQQKMQYSLNPFRLAGKANR